MTMLASLARAYERMEKRGEVPPFGYSLQNISYVIRLNENGVLAGPPADIRDLGGKKPVPRRMAVPQPVKRTSGIASNFLWDKTSYVLGVTSGEGRRLIDEHTEFIRRHKEALADTEDVGLLALLRFLDSWTPDQFDAPGWPEDMKDQNVAFALESERLDGICLHDRPAARELWTRISAEGDKTEAICLLTGEREPIARLHPAIKGVWGAQSSGASIVSFNLDAFESYGHAQGENAPVSEIAAAAYTGALNKFLETGSRNRVQIGDTSTVFWADASDRDAARIAEDSFLAMLNEANEGEEAKKVGAILEKIRKGQRLEEFEPGLAEGVRFHVLGLAPNAARLSIRFWFEDDFGQLAKNYQRFVEDMRIEPPPYNNPNPPLWRYLTETAAQGKRENIPPNLAGEWMRAILTGQRYPLTLLSTVLMRIRAGGAVNPYRAAMLKAVTNHYAHQSERTIKMALDPENTDPAYLLGRLFAVLERFQTLALGNVNATIRDRYFGSASATPRTVFPILIRMYQHHRSKAEKGDKPGLAGYFAGQLSEIMNLLPPELPATLPLKEQGKFALGYFHQLNRRKDVEIAPEELAQEEKAA